jgi:transposase
MGANYLTKPWNICGCWRCGELSKMGRGRQYGYLRHFSAQLHERPTPEGILGRGWSSRAQSHHRQNYLAETKGCLELHFLPPCAPDLNPDEFLWNYMKNTGVSKNPLKKNESLRERVEQDLVNISLDAILVASFFLAESVAYTAD